MAAPKKRRRRRVVRPPVKPPVVDEVEEIEEEEDFEEEEEVVVAKPKTRRRTRKVKPPVKKKVAVEEVEEEEYEEEEYEEDENPLPHFMDLMEEGQVLLISKTDDDTWLMSIGEGQVLSGAQKLKGKAYWDEVLSPEFQEHNSTWKELTYDEKVKEAKKLKVEWDSHENPKVDVMRITDKVRQHLGISKYKPEYAGRSDRAAIRA